MFHQFAKAIIVLIFAAHTVTTNGNVFAQKWADDMFKVKEYNFGNVSRNAKAEYEFEVYNPYVEDIHIRSVSASCSCTSVSVDKGTIKTYETGKVKAHLNTDRFSGDRRATLTVVIDKPFYATVQLHVKGNIRSDINFQPGEVNFGTVSSGKAVEKQVDFTYQGRSDWKVTAMKSTNEDVTAELTEISRNYGQIRYKLVVKLASDAQPGFINDRIVLVSNEGANREIPIMVQGKVNPGVTVSPSTLFVGNLEPGQEVTKKIIVRAEAPFAIKEVTCPNEHYSFELAPVANDEVQSRNIHFITVSYKAPESDSEEQFTDTIRIVTDAQSTPLELQVHAKVLGDSQVDTKPPAETATPGDKTQNKPLRDFSLTNNLIQ